MPDFSALQTLYGPTAFIIEPYGSTVNLFRCGDRSVANYANLDAAMAVVIANTNDPSVIVTSGVYNLPGGFTGWSPPIHFKFIAESNTYINVPSGYTGGLWKFNPNNAVIYYVHIEGGIYDEQSPQSNNWNCLDFNPTGSSPYGAIFSSTFKHMKIWRCNKPINLHSTDLSWINQNRFEDIYIEACKYIGAYFSHTGTYTQNQSGMCANTFIDVSGQATVVNGTLHYPDVVGGWLIDYGQWNSLINCNPWDMFQVPASISCTIGTNSVGTQIYGGLVTNQNFSDSGQHTQVYDDWQGLKTWNGLFTGRSRPTNAHGWDPALIVNRNVDSNGFENIARFTRGGSSDMLTIENGSDAVGSYGTIFRAIATSTNFPDWLEPFLIQAYIKNANDVANESPLVILSARTQSTPFLIANRPIASVRNYGTDVVLFWKNGIDLKGNDVMRAILRGIRWGISSTKSTDVTAATNELIIPVSASGGNRILTLPTVASAEAGRVYVIQKTDSSANTVTIDPSGAETINGAANLVLTAQYQCAVIWNDGGEWKTQLNVLERGGKATANGNGSTTVFNIAHGLGSTPNHAFVQCQSHNIGFTYTYDGTNITVTFATAPGSGTNNVIFNWKAVK